MPPVDFFIPIGSEEDERQLVDPAGDEAQHIKAGAVCPVQVFQHEHERSRRREGNQELARLQEEIRLARCTIQAGDGRSAGDVASLNTPGDLNPRAIGWRLRAVITVTGEDLHSRVRGLAAECIRERALADAGLTADQDEATPTVARRGQAIMQEGEFTVASNQRWGGRRCRSNIHPRPSRSGADDGARRRDGRAQAYTQGGPSQAKWF
jgi:hypothetical protein